MAPLSSYLSLMRIDKPVGVLLLLWPTLGALWAAAGGIPPILQIAVFCVGTFLMRAAGCVINDLADRNFDSEVSRTCDRPLATGAISVRQAWQLFALLSTLAVLLLPFLSPLACWLAIPGFLIAASYPLFKRWTYLPQVVLGTAFSWGLLIAYASIQNRLPQEAWLLFLGSVCWIVAYDTLYAMVDREDDIRVGIKSTAILFGQADRFMVGLLQTCTLVVWILFGRYLDYGIFYQLGLVAVAGLFVYQQVLIRRRNLDACLAAFRNNQWVGFALFLGIVFHVQFQPLVTTGI